MGSKIELTAPKLKRRLRPLGDPDFKTGQQRFFKEPVKFLSVRAPQAHKPAISHTQPRAVADFLLADIERFSRTTVRYACEKIPRPLRAKVMSA